MEIEKEEKKYLIKSIHGENNDKRKTVRERKRKIPVGNYKYREI